MARISFDQQRPQRSAQALDFMTATASDQGGARVEQAAGASSDRGVSRPVSPQRAATSPESELSGRAPIPRALQEFYETHSLTRSRTVVCCDVVHCVAVKLRVLRCAVMLCTVR